MPYFSLARATLSNTGFGSTTKAASPKVVIQLSRVLQVHQRGCYLCRMERRASPDKYNEDNYHVGLQLVLNLGLPHVVNENKRNLRVNGLGGSAQFLPAYNDQVKYCCLRR
jgi:hypothetical protein